MKTDRVSKPAMCGLVIAGVEDGAVTSACCDLQYLLLQWNGSGLHPEEIEEMEVGQATPCRHSLHSRTLMGVRAHRRLTVSRRAPHCQLQAELYEAKMEREEAERTRDVALTALFTGVEKSQEIRRSIAEIKKATEGRLPPSDAKVGTNPCVGVVMALSS